MSEENPIGPDGDNYGQAQFTEAMHQLLVAHQDEEAVAIPVTPDPTVRAKARRVQRLADVKAYEQLGLKLLRIKARKLGEVGNYIVEKLGVKKIGHGTIVAASDNADEYIIKCDAIVSELMARNPPVDPAVIVQMMQLIRDFNRQLLDTGEAHIKADRQPTFQTSGDTLHVPFPPGTPMMIGVSPTAKHTTPEIAQSIEATPPAP